MQEPGRTFSSSSNYRYGFNGKESDNEIKGQGVEIDYGRRIYDTRIAKFLSLDPLQSKYPELTPFQFANNSPITNIDLDGLEEYHYSLTLDKQGKTQLRLLSTKTENSHSFFGFTWTTPIYVKRYKVDYNGNSYYIGFAGSHGRGNENGSDRFEEFAENPDANKFPELFLNERESYELEGANIINGIIINRLLYGSINSQTASIPTEETPTQVHDGNTNATESNTSSRPTPQQSEDELSPPDADQQVAFKNGNVVPKNTKGSVRPEAYQFNSKQSFEVKNYDINRKNGIKDLVNNVVKQARQRLSNLPSGSTQNVIIDVRGQKATQSTLNQIRNKISTQVGTKNINVSFKTSE